MSADIRLSDLWGDPTPTTKARLLLLAMWTFADEHQLCRLTVEQLSTQTGIRRAVVVALLGMLMHKGRMRRLTRGGIASQLLAPNRDTPLAPAVLRSDRRVLRCQAIASHLAPEGSIK